MNMTSKGLITLHWIRVISQPVREVFQQVKKKWPQVLLHTDAAQAIGKIPVHVDKLCTDYLTIVGHKVCKPYRDT